MPVRMHGRFVMLQQWSCEMLFVHGLKTLVWIMHGLQGAQMITCMLLLLLLSAIGSLCRPQDMSLKSPGSAQQDRSGHGRAPGLARTLERSSKSCLRMPARARAACRVFMPDTRAVEAPFSLRVRSASISSSLRCVTSTRRFLASTFSTRTCAAHTAHITCLVYNTQGLLGRSWHLN